jgi:PAS domain S-box-containing protein
MLLALCLVGLQLAAVGFVVFSSYVTSERALIDHARALLSDVGTNTIEHSKGFLKPAEGAAMLATRLAESKVVASDDPQLLEQLLFEQLQISPQFAGVFYGDTAGDFVYVMRSSGPGPFRTKIIDNTPEDRLVSLIWRDDTYGVVETLMDPDDLYDPRARPWYTEAYDARAPIWTDPYIFFSSQQPGITVASPVLSADGIPQGVIGVDIEISAISGFLSDLQVGESGTALILNSNGDVIAHPDQQLIKTEDPDGSLRFVGIDEIADPIARAAFGGIAAEGEISVERELSSGFDYDGQLYVSTVMPVISDQLPWTIAVYAPEQDFIGGIKQNRTQNIWIASAIALATGLVGLLLAHYIHKPVRAFAVRSALIDQGEISPSAPMPATYQELEHANETLVQAIAARKKSEREYGRTFDLATRGMAQIAMEDGQFIRVNARLAEMLGYDSDEMLGMRIHQLTHADDAAEDLFTLEGSTELDSEHVQDRRWVTKSGAELWVSVNLILIRDDAGQVLHGVVTVDDITDSKLANHKIDQLSRDLSHSARVNMMGQMATTLAHEVNQPLTAITQNIDTALYVSTKDAGLSDELVQLLKDTDRQAHRAGDIIRALRGFVRKDRIEKQEFSLEELLSQTLHLVGAEAKEHRTAIRILPSDVKTVYGSRVQIAQVLVNLLRNAIEAMASSEAEARLITVGVQGGGGRVQIDITDTGPGFPVGMEPFTQFETSKQNGMGLGLSICRTIIEAHGGELWYEPTDRGGAQFCFTLPSLPTGTASSQVSHVSA